MQRLRIRFSRGQEIKFISHLDIVRMWERALHRAGVPLAYSEGFSQHPRIAIAAPLSVGVTSEAELMDLFCTRWVAGHSLEESVNAQLPPGMRILQVQPVGLNLPSLQASVRFAEYIVEVETDKDQDEVQLLLISLLHTETLPWQHQRDTGPRKYDLRALIDNLSLKDFQSPYATIGMKLRCDSGGSGRPEQVTAALRFSHYPKSIHRTRLVLETPQRQTGERKRGKN